MSIAVPASAAGRRRLLMPARACTVLCLVWGYSWVLFKLGLADAAPFDFAALRTLLAASLLLLALPLVGRPLATRRWRELFVLGLLNTAGPMGCSQWALVEGAANRTSILMYTMPFWTLLLARPLLGERVRGLQWLAVAAAGGGLVCVLQPWAPGGTSTSSLVAMLGALFWAGSVIMIKRMLAREPMDLLALTAWQMLLGALVLGAIALGVDAAPVTWSGRFIVVLTVTAIISTGCGWVLWVYLLYVLPAGTASLMTLLVPVIAVVATSWQLGEELAPSDLWGITLIVAGLALLAVQALRAHRSVTGIAAAE
ncbi:MAG: DMT family transporter [Gammaproteobacteria bacterium]